MKIGVVSLFIIGLLLAASTSADWTIFCQNREPGCPEVLIDIATVNGKDVCAVGGYASTRQEDHQMGLYCTTYDRVDEFKRLNHSSVLGMPVSISANEQGEVVTAGMGFLNYSSGIWYSHDLLKVNGSNVMNAIGQDIKLMQNKGFTAPTTVGWVGSIDLNTGEEGMLISRDGGMSYYSQPIHPGMRNLRYGAYLNFPSHSAWYITAGDWPTSIQQEKEDLNNRCLRMSMHLCTPAPHFSAQQIAKLNRARVYNPLRQSIKKLMSGGSEYYGNIFKSVDFGATWTVSFETNQFYFNDISCSDEIHCVAVAENQGSAVIYFTKDGGENWSVVLELHSSLMVSLFRAKTVTLPNGDIEYWASGGMWCDDQGKLVGLIYRSLDGETWTQEAVIDEVGIMMGLSFANDGQHGYALGSTQSQQTFIARFDRN